MAVDYDGEYPSGSAGNECAGEMVTYLRSVLSTTDAAAVIFDFRDLYYTWGDAIGGLAWALQKRATGFRPSAIVATGDTARALEPLLGEHFVFGVFGTKMFNSMPEAIAHLEGILGQETG
jgi:hypothetical protein